MKRFAQIFEDQAAHLDEKRILGVPVVIFAAVYIAVIRPGDVVGFAAIAGFGGALLGLAVAGDQGKLG